MISSTSPPEQKPRPSPVITSTRTSPRCGSSVDEVAQLRVDLERQRVELVGPVQRDRRDPALDGERRSAASRSQRRARAVRAHRAPTILDIELRSNVRYARGREDRWLRDSPYWNPKTETLERERLDALQLAKLRRQGAWAAASQPLVPAALADGFDARPAAVARRPAAAADADARRVDGLPGRHPPYGELPAIGGDGAIRVHTTSGTTGAARCGRSTRARTGRGSPRCGRTRSGAAASGRADIAYIAFGYGSFIGFWGLHYSMEKMGVLNVPGGAQTDRGARAPDRRLRRDRRRLDPDLRAAARAGGRSRSASTCPARPCSG